MSHCATGNLNAVDLFCTGLRLFRFRREEKQKEKKTKEKLTIRVERIRLDYRRQSDDILSTIVSLIVRKFICY